MTDRQYNVVIISVPWLLCVWKNTQSIDNQLEEKNAPNFKNLIMVKKHTVAEVIAWGNEHWVIFSSSILAWLFYKVGMCWLSAITFKENWGQNQPQKKKLLTLVHYCYFNELEGVLHPVTLPRNETLLLSALGNSAFTSLYWLFVRKHRVKRWSCS